MKAGASGKKLARGLVTKAVAPSNVTPLPVCRWGSGGHCGHVLRLGSPRSRKRRSAMGAVRRLTAVPVRVVAVLAVLGAGLAMGGAEAATPTSGSGTPTQKTASLTAMPPKFKA